ncbi:MAG: hypothetical protein LWX56_14605 [Ignavibacteria bacterium]|nr:hypothetical protein [Ignavibacteria bacterium]
MRWRSKLLFSLFVVVFSQLAMAQPVSASMSIVVRKPLPAMDFGSFVIGNDLPRQYDVFSVILGGVNGRPVQIYGKLSWVDIGSNTPELMVEFISRRFPARTFTNADLGTFIPIKNHKEINSVIQRNLAKGKPVGRYILELVLLDPISPRDGDDWNLGAAFSPDKVLATAVSNEDLVMENPTQTFVITEPTLPIVDAGNVQATWTPVTGVSYYKIRACYKRTPDQNMGDALRSGVPIINDKNVGVMTSVNLRQYMDRDWEPGKFVVFQVTGYIEGIGQQTIVTQPVNFLIRPQVSAQQQPLVNSLTIAAQNFLNSLPPQFVSNLINGNIAITEIRDENGNVITQAQVAQIVAFLQAHPDAIKNIVLRAK